MTTNFYRVRVIDPNLCEEASFRTHDVGKPGGHMRIACRTKKKTKKKKDWVTQAWRLPRNEWTIQNGTLVPKSRRAQRMNRQLTRNGKIIKQKDDFDFVLE